MFNSNKNSVQIHCHCRTKDFVTPCGQNPLIFRYNRSIQITLVSEITMKYYNRNGV